ncbi:hypothetical protein KC19_7G150300 [Ceratodon purpureus]|uniref:Uncharacterized protein n=1 Tax=Ceratodon purpureus TaxID=3225 RepID=A0A8T0HAF1_CERPU|nr:hypothetical protein KC19_7G150300 [Ceratodon purpureus]
MSVCVLYVRCLWLLKVGEEEVECVGGGYLYGIGLCWVGDFRMLR